jgi:chromosome partitioning protein
MSVEQGAHLEWLAGLGPEGTLAVMIGAALALLGVGVGAGRLLFSPKSDPELQALSLSAQRENQVFRRRLEATDRLINALKYERDLWNLRDPVRPPGYQEWIVRPSPKVLLIANLKGGVGKTTLSANLAAYFDQKRGARVLLIDMDYQGSLSNMLVRASRAPEAESQVQKILSGDWDGGAVCAAARDLRPNLTRSKLIMADYRLASAENRLMIEWAFDDSGIDTRFSLARALMHPRIKERFDLVILDAPPRLTFGMINALGAASHVLIPTVIDRMSAEAVGNFLAAMRGLRGDLNPLIKVAGVVLTLAPDVRLGGPQQDALPMLMDALHIWEEGGVVFNAHIPRRQSIAGAAGVEIAYTLPGADGADARALFDPLGDEVAAAIGWQPSSRQVMVYDDPDED